MNMSAFLIIVRSEHYINYLSIKKYNKGTHYIYIYIFIPIYMYIYIMYADLDHPILNSLCVSHSVHAEQRIYPLTTYLMKDSSLSRIEDQFVSQYKDTNLALHYIYIQCSTGFIVETALL